MRFGRSTANVTALGSLTFSYDHSDQPVATGGSAVGSYVYDGHLRRVRATSGGVTRYNVFDLSGRLVFVDTPSAGTSVAYVPGPEGTLARVDQAGVVSFQHADHLGSGASATNATGAVLWRERYTPFGEKLLAPAANDNQASFTGHIDDAATGLTYMQARYYDPALGRFLSIEPCRAFSTWISSQGMKSCAGAHRLQSRWSSAPPARTCSTTTPTPPTIR